MFDLDRSGTVDVHEFEKLYAYINQWLAVFKTYDRDQSGHIEEGELSQGEWKNCRTDEFTFSNFFFFFNFSIDANGISIFTGFYQVSGLQIGPDNP
jgi:hypothetical protein